ncbi:MAG: hypothetical protein IT285_04920 [Bdellovibrionales bacterium]|nr:hypothetical protein [Bdellovibrionales bacterium]
MLVLIAAPAGAAPIEVHGHRGARAAFPENSLPAFQHALEVGADYLELDVRLTADGTVVVHHDPELSPTRCLDAEGAPAAAGLRISRLRLEELQSYDCGSLTNPEFPGQQAVPRTKVPTLSEVFSLVRQSPLAQAARVGVHIEIKTGGGVPRPSRMVPPVIAVIREAGFLDRVVIQSFDPRYAWAARRALRAEGVEARRVISPPFALARGRAGRLFVRALQALGQAVIPWTANTPEEWDTLLANGVDGIVTDDPAGLIEYLRRRSRGSAQF